MSTVAAQWRNGVDTAALFATLDAVKAQPEAARFRFSVRNRWISGTRNRNEISTFFGVGAEQQRAGTFAVDADHPEVLVGGDAAPTPAELLLAALASCLTSGLGNIAAVRKITLESVESRVEGDIDLRGILGLSDEVRNGFEQIRVSFRVRGDASPEELQRLVQQAGQRLHVTRERRRPDGGEPAGMGVLRDRAEQARLANAGLARDE